MSWARQPLKHLAEVSVSNVDKKTVEGEMPVRLVNYTDVYYGDRLTPDLGLMSATATTRQLEAFRLRPGDVIITKDSETPDDIGVSAYVERSAPDMVCGYHLAVLRPRPGRVDGRYLYWSMKSDDALGQMSAGATGVTRHGLRTDVIASTAIQVPELGEQRAIADFLDIETARIDALAIKKRRMIALHRGRLMVRANELTRRGDEVRAGRLLAKVKTGTTPGGENSDLISDDGEIEWTSPADVSPSLSLLRARRFVDRRAVREGLVPLFPAQSVVIVGIGATAGKVAHVDRDVSGNQQMTCLVPSPGLDARFLAWQLYARSDEIRATAPYTTLPILNNDFLRSVTLHVPEALTQRDHAAALDAELQRFERLESVLSRQLELLDEHRRALVTAAVTGELEVPGVAA